MAAKGQLLPPSLPLAIMVERVMERIDMRSELVAVFIVGGKLLCTRESSASFAPNINRLQSNLVGVYDHGADCRAVKEDLSMFYESTSKRQEVA